MRTERRVSSSASIMDSSVCDTEPVGLQKENPFIYFMAAGHGLLSNFSSPWTCNGGFSLWQSYYWLFFLIWIILQWQENEFPVSRAWLHLCSSFNSLPVVVVASLWTLCGKLCECCLLGDNLWLIRVFVFLFLNGFVCTLLNDGFETCAPFVGVNLELSDWWDLIQILHLQLHS